MTSSERPTLLQRRWRNLLAWLEGHDFDVQSLPVVCREMAFAGNGLYARSACMPGSLLFAVPPEVLMNKMTLKRLYPPDNALTAMQLISMHLFIWRPKSDNEDSTDPFFGPYISILPRDFSSHPLTWFVLSKLDKAHDMQISLLNYLPPSILAALHRLYTRFWTDWCKVRAFLQSMSSISLATQKTSSSLEALDTVMHFLWAWLNVNTRCIYYRLKHAKTDPDNITMCPIADFANHTSGQAYMTLVPPNARHWDTAPMNSIGDGLKFVSLNNVKIEKNDEIFLTYGPHSNKTLFVEYGFVNVFSENGPSPSGEVDVQDLVEKHVFADGQLQVREAMRVALVSEGYWGDWTLHSTPDGAQPSWRLITALRLYHLVVSVSSADDDTLQPWREVVSGKQPLVSYENEQSWRKTVVFLCDMLIKRAEESIAMSAPDKEGEDSWIGWMSENIRSLWKEELFVARGVKDSILRGDEF